VVSHADCREEAARANLLLLGSREGRAVPFLLRKNGDENLALALHPQEIRSEPSLTGLDAGSYRKVLSGGCASGLGMTGCGPIWGVLPF
jgi:hypothetical protein